MEDLSNIKQEIKEKKGKEWIGLQLTTEKQLETLMWYLDHPKIEENPKIAKELVEVYYSAKASSFMKMEGIIRKLDQLIIMFGDQLQPIQKKGDAEFINTPQEIEILKKRIEDFQQTSSWRSLPELTTDAVSTFLEFLYHPNLQNKSILFDEMLKKYDATESNDFMKMQTFKDLLIKIDIKLGPVPVVVEKEEIEEEVKVEETSIEEGVPAEKGIVCNDCGTENRLNAKFCDNCGKNLIEKQIILEDIEQDVEDVVNAIETSVEETENVEEEILGETGQPEDKIEDELGQTEEEIVEETYTPEDEIVEKVEKTEAENEEVTEKDEDDFWVK